MQPLCYVHTQYALEFTKLPRVQNILSLYLDVFRKQAIFVDAFRSNFDILINFKFCDFMTELLDYLLFQK